jgi:hypothetical protein
VELPAIVPPPIGACSGSKKMSDSARDKKASVPDKAKRVPAAPDDDRMEDEEKIMAGRHDVNYQAHLTKDVPGG